jgi:hypothetical protein
MTATLPVSISSQVSLWILSNRASSTASVSSATVLQAQQESRPTCCCVMKCSRLGKWEGLVRQAAETEATNERCYEMK